MKFLILFLSSFFMASSYSSDIRLGLSQSGIKKAIKSALDVIGRDKDSILIPMITEYQKVEASQINNNIVIKKMREIISFNDEDDFNYRMRVQPITLKYNLLDDETFIWVEGDSHNFNLYAKVTMNRLNIESRSIEICEIKKQRCLKNNGVYAKASNINIKNYGNQYIDILVGLNLKINEEKVTISLTDFLSSLYMPKTKHEKDLFRKSDMRTYIPKFDLSFGRLDIPAPKLIVNGDTIELDVSNLKNVILSEKAFLTKELVNYIGSYLTKDLIKLLNEKFLQSLSKIKKEFKLLDYDEDFIRGVGNSELDLNRYRSAVDNTYVDISRNQYMSHLNHQEEQIENINFMDNMLTIIKRYVHKAEYSLTYKGVGMNHNSFQLNFDSSHQINFHESNRIQTIHNSSSLIRDMEMSSLVQNKHDLGFTFSETLINSFLKSLDDSELINDTLNHLDVDLSGIWLNGFHFHIDRNFNHRDSRFYKVGTHSEYKNNSSIALVVEVSIKLNQMTSNSVGSWIENGIGNILEGGQRVWFPIELRLKPTIVDDCGKKKLYFNVFSPAASNKLANTYGYKYKENISSKVESGVIKTIKKLIEESFTNLPSFVDITTTFKKFGIDISPQELVVEENGYLSIYGDIDRLNYVELSESAKGKK